jgi:hypothetical protein
MHTSLSRGSLVMAMTAGGIYHATVLIALATVLVLST